MRILIIGGTGLISTSLTRQLLARGMDVTLYNRGRAEARFPEGAKRLTGDRKEYATFEARMAEAGQWDCVIDQRRRSVRRPRYRRLGAAGDGNGRRAGGSAVTSSFAGPSGFRLARAGIP